MKRGRIKTAMTRQQVEQWILENFFDYRDENFDVRIALKDSANTAAEIREVLIEKLQDFAKLQSL